MADAKPADGQRETNGGPKRNRRPAYLKALDGRKKGAGRHIEGRG